jgi:hypothetical protein
MSDFVKKPFTAPLAQEKAATETPKISLNQMEMIKFMLDMRYSRKRQIMKRFGDSDVTRVELGALLQAGHIKTKDSDLVAESLLIPTLAGYSALKEIAEGVHLPEPIQRLFEPMVRHDILLGDIRIKFEELNFIERWNSEEMLKVLPGFAALMRDLPDAMCERKDGPRYFLELEISQKTKKQYSERIQEYLQLIELPALKSQNVTGVIFICTDPHVQKIIKELLPVGNKGFSALHISRYLKDFEPSEKGN